MYPLEPSERVSASAEVGYTLQYPKREAFHVKK